VNVLIVNNLRAGQGDAGLYSYVRELVTQGCHVTVRPLTSESPLDVLLADATTFDRVVTAGGDGTASGIAYALRGSGVPIVVYPAGTGNVLALNLKMPPMPSELARITLEGVPLLTDMGEITLDCGPRDPAGAQMSDTFGFLNGAGAGFDARIMEGARELKPIIGMGAYFVSAMQVRQPQVSRFEIDLDGEQIEREGIAVMLINFGKMLLDFSLTHDGSAHDGELEVVVIRTKHMAGLVPAVWAVFLDRIVDHPGRSESLEILRGKQVRVVADPPLPVQYDGEIMPCTTPFEGRVLPDAATFVVPAAYVPDTGKE
jgi:diacylglycerol kinase family enzyme